MRCAPWLGRKLQLDAISPTPARPSCFARGNRKSVGWVGLCCGFDRSDRPPAGFIMRLAAKQIITQDITSRVFSTSAQGSRRLFGFLRLR